MKTIVQTVVFLILELTAAFIVFGGIAIAWIAF